VHLPRRRRPATSTARGAGPRPQASRPRRWELGEAPVDAVGGRHAVVSQVERHDVAVDLAAKGGVRPQRLELRTEEERPARPAVVHRLLAEAVARQMQASLVAVPQRQGEHTGAAHQGVVQSPPLHRGEQDLGVRRPPEAMPAALELGAQLGEVVDLAVVGEHVAAIRGFHRLVPGLGQVDHGQTTGPERHTRRLIDERPGVVRAPVGDGVGHGHDQAAHRRRGAGRARGALAVPEPRYAAHEPGARVTGPCTPPPVG